MQAVILAAGKGARLGRLTHSRSKAMQPILGAPMFQRVMESLLPNGIDDFILVVDPADGDIQEYCINHLADDCKFQITFQEEKLGTAHALAKARPFIGDKFILSACDNLIPTEDLARFFAIWGEDDSLDGLLALQEVPPERIPSGAIVELNGSQVIRIIEKPSIESAPSNIASLPLYGFNQRILPYLDQLTLSSRGEYEIQEAIQKRIDAGGLIHGIQVSSRLTLSVPSDLLAINLHYLQNGSPPEEIIQSDSIGANTLLIPPVWIGSKTVIGPSCRIGPEVYIEGDCKLGDRVRISRSVILRGSIIPRKSNIDEEIFYPKT